MTERRTMLRRLSTLILAGALGLTLAGCPGSTETRDELDCDDFVYQDEAQEQWDLDHDDPHNLDEDGNGKPCEDLPERPPFPVPTS